MKESGQREVWDHIRRARSLCSSPLVHSYLTFVSEEQKQVEVQVNQAAPMLEHALINLLRDMRSRAQVASSLAERISLTRGVAYQVVYLALFPMRRDYDLSFTMGSHMLRIPASKGLIFNFQFGKTLRASCEAVVESADRDCPAICAFGVVTAYISVVQQIGWNLITGHLFPVALSLPAARMAANQQSHLRMAHLPNHFLMHSFRVGDSLSKSLAGRAVHEIMKIGGWKAESSVAKYYIGATLSGQVRGRITWPELRGR